MRSVCSPHHRPTPVVEKLNLSQGKLPDRRSGRCINSLKADRKKLNLISVQLFALSLAITVGDKILDLPPAQVLGIGDSYAGLSAAGCMPGSETDGTRISIGGSISIGLSEFASDGEASVVRGRHSER